MRNRPNIRSVIFCLGILFLSHKAFGQEPTGLPFLKIGLGARQAGMGEVFTGVCDDGFAMHWNPGGLGHLRRWQWAASYNRWFTDVYQANLLYIRQFRMLGSRKTALGVYASYLGMPSWDSTGGDKPSVDAGHFTAGFAVGQRLDWLSKSLSIGANIRFVSSQLDDYGAKGFSGDAGIMFMPERFKLGDLGLGLFEYGRIGIGFALQHWGQGMTFDTQSSSFPVTLRGGASLKVGKYNGLSWLIAGDVIDVQDKDLTIGVGTELWWRDIIGIRVGYRMNDKDLGDFTFGVSFRWDDIMNSLLNLPTRFGDAIQIDVADMDFGNVLNQTYRGTISHYPVAPEPFRLDDPNVVTSQVMGESSVVRLAWEKAPDPDLFDEVKYYVFVDQNEARVEEAVKWAEMDLRGFLSSNLADSLMRCDPVTYPNYATEVTEGGIYYWAVVAYDLADHAQLAQKGSHHVAEFTIETADLLVRDIEFNHDSYITTTPEQGSLTVSIANNGIKPADPFRFMLYDHYTENAHFDPKLLYSTTIHHLDVKEDTTITIPWSTSENGLHLIQAIVDPDSVNLELNRENNRYSEPFVTIPKGVITTQDTVQMISTDFTSIEIPLVPEIYFDPFSSTVDSLYYTDTDILPAVLNTMAVRMAARSNITLNIMGHIDLFTKEANPVLADERANAVRNKLIELGAPSSRLNVVTDHDNKVLGKNSRPASRQDTLWVMEQNRMVSFSVNTEYEDYVFGPNRVAVDTTTVDSVLFASRIYSPGEINEWYVSGAPQDIRIEDETIASGNRLFGEFAWDGLNLRKILVPRNRWYSYSLVLTDSLGRRFQTYPDSVYLKEVRTIRRREIFGSAKFAQTNPVYDFYLEKLMDVVQELIQDGNTKIRFEGHACKVGTDAVNQRLSYQRAARFNNAFKQRIRETYPNTYRTIWERIEDPVGFGERIPLAIQWQGNTILLGDNNHPVGRFQNRRIMVSLYRIHDQLPRP